MNEAIIGILAAIADKDETVTDKVEAAEQALGRGEPSLRDSLLTSDYTRV